MGYEIWANPIIGWLGTAGVIAYAVHIHRHRTRSSVERMMLVLLYCLGALFFLRGFYWLTDVDWLMRPSFLPATLLPLALTLFVEALLRRHAPLGLKAFVVIGTVACFVLNFGPLTTRDALWTVSRVLTLVTFAWLGWLVVTRDRSAHAPMENRFLNGFMSALAFAFLLAMTDLQVAPEWLHFRLGGIGALILVYVCVRLSDQDESPTVVVRELLSVAIKALIATLTFGLLIPPGDVDMYLAIYFTALSFVLLYTIVGRLQGLERQHRQTSFFQWLVGARTESVEDFVDDLDQLPVAREHLVLRGAELELYEPEVMADTFDNGHPVWTLGGLRSRLRVQRDDRGGTEQLLEMLEHNQMTHVALLSNQPHVFLLLNLPQFAGTHNPVLEVAVLQKYARLLSPRVS